MHSVLKLTNSCFSVCSAKFLYCCYHNHHPCRQTLFLGKNVNMNEILSCLQPRNFSLKRSRNFMVESLTLETISWKGEKKLGGEKVLSLDLTGKIRLWIWQIILQKPFLVISKVNLITENLEGVGLTQFLYRGSLLPSFSGMLHILLTPNERQMLFIIFVNDVKIGFHSFKKNLEHFLWSRTRGIFTCQILVFLELRLEKG